MILVYKCITEPQSNHHQNINIFFHIEQFHCISTFDCIKRNFKKSQNKSINFAQPNQFQEKFQNNVLYHSKYFQSILLRGCLYGGKPAWVSKLARFVPTDFTLCLHETATGLTAINGIYTVI